MIELDRLVNASGLVSLAGQWLQVGFPLAGQRITLRLEQHLVHVVIDGRLWRTLPSPIPPAARGRLRGARLAAPPQIPDGPVRVYRRVSSRGALQVCRQRVHVGLPHAGKTVTVEVDDTCFRILDHHDTILTVVPRTNTEEVTRYKAYGHKAARARGRVFDFKKEILALETAELLREVITSFKAVDLYPNVVSNADMGDAFEYIIRKFNEAANVTSGDHYTADHWVP